MRCAVLGIALFVCVAARAGAAGAEGPARSDPRQAAAGLKVPAGFQVGLFAAEPDVRQPIAMTTDSRGRLWVVENFTYDDAKVNFDLTKRDRILILEDVDHDGRAEKRAVFWDQGQKTTSVEVGFGGVWVLCAPRLLFLPDRDEDDRPDGEPVVVLDGWEDTAIRHNIVNGLKWGPDGWLYGRHGIQDVSYVGPPGAPADQRVMVNCALWRYHPTRQVFEVVCRGGTNPWGLDWNEVGEPFLINTVIGHLYHAVPGAYFERMYGEHANPYLYRLLGPSADHYHWDTAEKWSDIRQKGVSKTTDEAGGGHAHCGLMIYQGDNWPDAYRGSLFTVNLHGLRVNNDRLERAGSGYLGRHAPDFLRSSDPWFRAVELISGPDGGVFLADWSDVGECHENDGVDRDSGRIYKITYGTPAKPTVADVSRLGDLELAGLQTHKNDWYARQARRVLQERAAAGRPMEPAQRALRALFEGAAPVPHKLRALWGLYVTGGTSQGWLLEQLAHPDEHVRSWVVRLLLESGAPTPEVVRAFRSRAESDPSGLVLLYLASALQRLEPAERWEIAEALADREAFVEDRVLPLMVWYGIEPAVPLYPERAVTMAGQSRMAAPAQYIARRLTQEIGRRPEPVAELVALLGRSRGDAARQLWILTGMSEALRGWRQARMPAGWEAVAAALRASPHEGIRRAAGELSVVFGDGRAQADLRALLADARADLDARRGALRVLAESRVEGLRPVILGLLSDRDLAADAIRALALANDADAARILIDRFRGLPKAARTEAVAALTARPESARALLDAVERGRIDRRQVPVFLVRQMQGFADAGMQQRIVALWPELGGLSAAARDRIARYKAALTPERLAQADLVNGHRLYARTCGSCHVLYGEGGKIGPDLTGSQRANLDYLLENLLDPSATVAADYRMSTVALSDGRILHGIVGGTGATVTIQTPTEKIVVPREEIVESRPSNLSIMPDGQLDVLTAGEVRDLIAYLMSPQPVPPPEGPAGPPAAP